MGSLVASVDGSDALWARALSVLAARRLRLHFQAALHRAVSARSDCRISNEASRGCAKPALCACAEMGSDSRGEATRGGGQRKAVPFQGGDAETQRTQVPHGWTIILAEKQHIN